jgi:hypothetical protein
MLVVFEKLGDDSSEEIDAVDVGSWDELGNEEDADEAEVETAGAGDEENEEKSKEEND